MKTIAIYSIKGGVGKTAAAVNLAYLSAQKGNQSLICDLDPQGASSYYFRISGSPKFDSGKLLNSTKKIHRNIKGTDFLNLDLLPSDFSYRNLDIELSEEKKPRKRLRRNIESLADEYSHLFLDCPPNLTLLSESVFAAADIILVPVIPTTLSMRTWEQLLEFFDRNKLDRSRIRGFFSMVETRKKLHREIMQAWGGLPGFLSQAVPYSSDVEKMGITRAPLIATSPKSTAAEAYRGLYEELQTL